MYVIYMEIFCRSRLYCSIQLITENNIGLYYADEALSSIDNWISVIKYQCGKYHNAFPFSDILLSRCCLDDVMHNKKQLPVVMLNFDVF